MNYLILYIMLIVFAIALKNVSKFKIGGNINLSILLMGFIFLIFCSSHIYYTRRVFFCLFLTACVYTGFCLIKNKYTWKELKNYVLTPSFILFTILFVTFAFILRNAELTGIDDTYFWSQLVRNSFELGTLFPKGIYLNVSFGTYPPFYVGYLSMICCLLGGYSEAFLLFGNTLFCVSFLVAIFDCIDTKEYPILYTVLSAVVSILVLFTVNWSPNLSHDTYLFNSIYVDWPLAVVFAYSFFRSVYKLQTKQEWFHYILALVALSTIKQVGSPLALLCFATQLLLLFYTSKFKKKKEVTIIAGIVFVLLALIPSIQNSLYIRLFEKIGETISLGISYPDKGKIVQIFINAMFNYEIVTHPFRISYIYLVLTFTGILMLLGFCKKSTSIKLGSIMYLIGAVGYAIVICLFYVYTMGSGEALDMVQFCRYMQVYTFAGIMIIVYLLLNNLSIKTLVSALIFCCLFVEPKSVYALKSNNLVYEYHDAVDELKKYVDDEYNYETILVLNQNDAIVAAKIRNAFGLKGQNVTYTLYDSNTSFEGFKTRVSGFDYLLIGEYNDYFYDAFWSKVSETNLVNFALYRVVMTEDGIDFYFVHSFAEESNYNNH